MASDGGENPVLQENVPPVNNTLSGKRLTKVEKARLEALSAFGNCRFDSMVVKKESFKAKLSATAKLNATSGKDSVRRLTRMEIARKEANEAFKNISLGEKRKASVTRKKSESQPAKKRLTRLERCKLEAQQAFGNVPLSTLTAGNVEKQEQNNSRIERPEVGTNHSSVKNVQTVKKDTKKSLGRRSIEKRKSTSKGKQTRRSRRSSAMMRRRSSTKGTRLTKVQASQLEAHKSFGGQSLENVWKSNKASPPTVESVAVTADDGCQSVKKSEILEDSLEPVAMITCDEGGTHQQNSGMEVETAPNKSVAESSSQTDCQLIDESSQVKGPSDNEMKTEEYESNKLNQIADALKMHVQNGATEAPHAQACEEHVKSINGMSPIREQSPPETCPRSSTMQFKSLTPVESKPLTRLEKARLEALQSFNGQAFDHVIKTSTRKMARYLTPVKHQATNTEVNLTRNTPSQTDDLYCIHHPRPNSSFYSNLRDNSFCDRGALLESSKMVVHTARSLDTPSPECSPANTLNP